MSFRSKTKNQWAGGDPPNYFSLDLSSHIACECARSDKKKRGQWVPEIQLRSLDEWRVRFEGRLNFRLPSGNLT